MKIKAVDIARALGLSTATVSLALNGKAGVSQETRDRVQEYMENCKIGNADCWPSQDRLIEIVIYIRTGYIVCDYDNNLLLEVLQTVESEARRCGYHVSIAYVHHNADESEQVVRMCNQPTVAGVILLAMEMLPIDFEPFYAIHKPLIVYDNDFHDGNYTYINIDNYSAVYNAVEQLCALGHTQIAYLQNSAWIYNFGQRRSAFKSLMQSKNLTPAIIEVGSEVGIIHENVKQLLENKKPLPTAFFFENYRVAIGALRALEECKISIPQSISVIGIDVLPTYVRCACKLSVVQVSHGTRAKMAWQHLLSEIQKTQEEHVHLFVNTCLLPGDSVRKL